MFVVVTIENSSSNLSSSWLAPETPNGVILGYNISCTSSKSEQVSFDASPTETSLVLTDLSPFTNYTCVVRARTVAGEGLPSNFSVARTDEGGKNEILLCQGLQFQS